MAILRNEEYVTNVSFKAVKVYFLLVLFKKCKCNVNVFLTLRDEF